MNLIASVLHLDREAVQALKIKDIYALHKVVYSLFPDVRNSSEKASSTPSGFLFADQGGNYQTRRILLLSDRRPAKKIRGQYGEVESKCVPDEFLSHDTYRFKVVVNPTRRENASRKLVPMKGREAIAQWFTERAVQSWGFEAVPSKLQVDRVDVLRFKNKTQSTVTLAQCEVQGVLKVSDRERFIEGFSKGIGRGRAFGCGLLQIAPITQLLYD